MGAAALAPKRQVWELADLKKKTVTGERSDTCHREPNEEQRPTCWLRVLACLWCSVYYTSSEGVSTYLLAFPTVPPRVNVRFRLIL